MRTWYCSKPAGHSPGSPHVARDEHLPFGDIVWYGPWEDGSYFDVPEGSGLRPWEPQEQTAPEKVDEWIEVEFDDRPDLGPHCPGIDTHPWRLSVYEGRAVLSSGCAECDDAVMSPMGGEDVNMDVGIVGRLHSHLETYRMADSTEYDHWWIFEPTQIGEPDV